MESWRAVGIEPFFGAQTLSEVPITQPGCGAARRGTAAFRHICFGRPELMLQDWPEGRESLLLAPGTQRVGRGCFSLLLQFVDAVGQITETGQHGGAVAAGGSTGVLTQSDIAPVMGAVFNGRPMAADQSDDGGIVVFVDGEARCVTTDFQGGRLFGLMLILGIALDSDDLPAAA